MIRAAAIIACVGAAAAAPDVRVARALGPKGYAMARVSVITTAPDASLAATNDYGSQFMYRWTDRYLYSSLVDVTAGGNTTVTLSTDAGDFDVSVSLPAEGAAVRGVIIADPCSNNTYMTCEYGHLFQTYTHTPALLNAFVGDSSVSFWGIIGDNWYDQNGEISAQAFAQLSTAVKSKFLYVSPGNHDMWVDGSPLTAVDEDQFGNGFMQYYPQDTVATLTNDLFDFSVDPDASNVTFKRSAATDNFFSYSVVGNVGLILYTSVAEYSASLPSFDEACSFMAADDSVDVVLLTAHWNAPGDGAGLKMPPGELIHFVQKDLDSCGGLKDKMYFIEGHMHCNKVLQGGKGFLIAGQGMEGCGNYGFPVFQTTEDGRFQVLYFPVADSDGLDQYDDLMACLDSNGIDGCLSFAETWLDVEI